MTNSEIVAQLKNGSEITFRYLYDKYYYQLNLFAYHIVMCEESHDIVHDIFTKLWEQRNTLNINTNINAYLYTAVRNSSFNYLKHNKILDTNKKKITEAILFVQEGWCEEDEMLMDNLKEIIEKLPPQQRAIIKLRFEGKSYDEIAIELAISQKTINNHIYKAYQFIRAAVFIQLFLFLSR